MGAAHAAPERLLGTDPATGAPVTLRRGPYGAYVQLGGAQAAGQAADSVNPGHSGADPPASSHAAAAPGVASGAAPNGADSGGAGRRTAEGTAGAPGEAGGAAGGSKGRKKGRSTAAEPGVRRSALRAGMDAADMTLADALALLAYPKVSWPSFAERVHTWVAEQAEGVAEVTKGVLAIKQKISLGGSLLCDVS